MPRKQRSAPCQHAQLLLQWAWGALRIGWGGVLPIAWGLCSACRMVWVQDVRQGPETVWGQSPRLPFQSISGTAMFEARQVSLCISTKGLTQ